LPIRLAQLCSSKVRHAGASTLCRGRVKLSATSSQGQTLIFKIAKPGEALGLSATVSGVPYDTTAETGQACQLNFVKQADFRQFLTEHSGACMHAAIHLGHECQQAYRQLRSFVMRSAPERIARLILDWSHGESGMATAVEIGPDVFRVTKLSVAE
jgi:CRP/FNR family transcriptional regulator, cyclic AMP receptor protein